LPLSALLSSGLGLGLVFFVEAMSVSKHFAREHGYELRANQELFALAAVNVAAGVTGAYPVGGSFSRSAVNSTSGARTPFCGVVTALFIGLTLLLLTGLFRFLPEAVLAAVIAQTLPGLLGVAYARKLFASARLEFALLALTFCATLALGIQVGLYSGLAASVCLFDATGARRTRWPWQRR
jgi:SulP family sulfate permease